MLRTCDEREQSEEVTHLGTTQNYYFIQSLGLYTHVRFVQYILLRESSWLTAYFIHKSITIENMPVADN